MNRLIWIAAAICTSLPASAQVVDPACFGVLPGTVAIRPSAPTNTEPIAVAVAAANFLGQSTVARINGNVIDVTMTGVSFGLQPPPFCGVVIVGPLTSGNYQVSYYLVRDGGAAQLQATLAFAVADIIPTMTTGGLIALALFLGGAAWLAFARHGRARRMT
jgi:hypothetical protein